MKVNTFTKAGRLLKIAHATYKRGEEELARDIFVLAMEEPDADQAIEPATQPTEDELKAQLMQAMEEGDMDKAGEIIDQMKGLQGQDEGEPTPEPEPEPEPKPEGGEPPAGEPAPELPPAQVASIVALAKKIKAAGHADLSKKITAALGL